VACGCRAMKFIPGAGARARQLVPSWPPSWLQESRRSQQTSAPNARFVGITKGMELMMCPHMAVDIAA
jgi:hypothetical protein